MKSRKTATIEDYPLSFRSATSELEKKINYKFKDKTKLYIALTHSSYSNEKSSFKYFPYNERYEFFGDSILSLVVSHSLFSSETNLPEGEMTRARAKIVCEDSLFNYAKQIELGKYLLLGHGEEVTNGRNRRSILADAFEALIAAIFEDGGHREATEFILKHAKSNIDLALSGEICQDYKSLLQQIVQNSKGETLEYILIKEEGPEHKKIFTSEVHISGNVIASGSGTTKRESEQAAAKEALLLFGEKQ